VHVNVYVNEKTTLAIVYVIVYVHVVVDVDVVGFLNPCFRPSLRVSYRAEPIRTSGIAIDCKTLRDRFWSLSSRTD
jgi:hypothetical protein